MEKIIEKNQKLIKKLRPLNEKQVLSLKEYFGVGFTYSSNRLEGNTLTESETASVIKNGITVSGKPIEYSYEASGHYLAFEYMLSLMRRRSISQDDIRIFHRLFYYKIDSKQAGRYRKTNVIITGSAYEPPSYKILNELIKDAIKTFNRFRKDYHITTAAALVHLRFVEIHPFIDGNGRVARLLMNTVLIQHGYPVVIIPTPLRRLYIAALETAHNRFKDRDISDDSDYYLFLTGNTYGYENAFIEFIQEQVITAQEDYLRLIKQ